MAYIVQSCKTEVAKLDLALIVDEDVGTLDVAVQEVLPVGVVEPFQHLLHDGRVERVGEFDLQSHRQLYFSIHRFSTNYYNI